MPIIPYILQWSVAKTVAGKKRWREKREQVFVDVSDEIAAFLKWDDGGEKRYIERTKKQKRKAKIKKTFSLDQMVKTNDSADEFPVGELIADIFHLDNFDPLEIVIGKETVSEREHERKHELERIIAEQEKKEAEFEKQYAPKLTKKQYEVWKYHKEGHSNVEIAALLNIDESSVRERIKNAKKRLKNES
ncbi:MAG: LuxR C-terminal-related transcriptional regulator [Firmicutes bacterium]|nr:LuxR C-terminal-related transcriptional regulator [Bacillota bacterium]